jgi:hypothetical protein
VYWRQAARRYPPIPVGVLVALIVLYSNIEVENTSDSPVCDFSHLTAPRQFSNLMNNFYCYWLLQNWCVFCKLIFQLIHYSVEVGLTLTFGTLNDEGLMFCIIFVLEVCLEFGWGLILCTFQSTSLFRIWLRLDYVHFP